MLVYIKSVTFLTFPNKLYTYKCLHLSFSLITFVAKSLHFQRDRKYIWFFFEVNSGVKLLVWIYSVLLKEVAKLFLYLSVGAAFFPMSTFYEVYLSKSVSLLSFREGQIQSANSLLCFPCFLKSLPLSICSPEKYILIWNPKGIKVTTVTFTVPILESSSCWKIKNLLCYHSHYLSALKYIISFIWIFYHDQDNDWQNKMKGSFILMYCLCCHQVLHTSIFYIYLLT